MEITSAEFVISNTDVKKCPPGIFPEYAFIGRSNVGKSSLINMLTGRKGLAMTSATPGKTMLINHFLINKSWYIVDLPGYGYARRGQKGKSQIQRIIEDYILEREQMTNLFLLIDSRLEPQVIDIEFMGWLGEHGIPFSIVFTKGDKLKGGRLNTNIQQYLKKLKEQWEELPPYFVTSSENRMGKKELLDYIESINKVSMALDNRIRRVDVNIDDIIGSDIYLILGGGVRYVRNKDELNKNLPEVDWNKLLNEIDEHFG